MSVYKLTTELEKEKADRFGKPRTSLGTVRSKVVDRKITNYNNEINGEPEPEAGEEEAQTIEDKFNE